MSLFFSKRISDAQVIVVFQCLRGWELHPYSWFAHFLQELQTKFSRKEGVRKQELWLGFAARLEASRGRIIESLQALYNSFLLFDVDQKCGQGAQIVVVQTMQAEVW